MSSSRVFFFSTPMNFFGVLFLFLATAVAAVAGGAAITFWCKFLPAGGFFYGETEAVKNQAPGASFWSIVTSCLDQEHDSYAWKESNLDLFSFLLQLYW
jgi:hypothetical protein